MKIMSIQVFVRVRYWWIIWSWSQITQQNGQATVNNVIFCLWRFAINMQYQVKNQGCYILEYFLWVHTFKLPDKLWCSQTIHICIRDAYMSDLCWHMALYQNNDLHLKKVLTHKQIQIYQWTNEGENMLLNTRRIHKFWSGQVFSRCFYPKHLQRLLALVGNRTFLWGGQPLFHHYILFTIPTF